MRLSLVALASSICLLAACSHEPKRAEAPPAMPPAQHNMAANQNGQSSGVSQAQMNAQQAEAQRLEAMKAQMADLNKGSVLFDFDNYVVKPSYSDMLGKQAQFLKSSPADHLTLQGNSDERGSVEYNLALGQKRADAVRKALTLLGAPEDRIETISFGEEKPKADCHDESCWSQNRRVDFVNAAH